MTGSSARNKHPSIFYRSLSFSKPPISLSLSLSLSQSPSLTNLTSFLSLTPPHTSLALSHRGTTSFSKANFGRSLVPLLFLALLLLKCNAKLPLSKLTSLYLSLSLPPSLARSLNLLSALAYIFPRRHLRLNRSLFICLSASPHLSHALPASDKQTNE